MIMPDGFSIFSIKLTEPNLITLQKVPFKYLKYTTLDGRPKWYTLNMEIREGENYKIIRKGNTNASLSDLLISHLFSMRSIKIHRRILRDRINDKREVEDAQYYNTLSRLKKRGYIEIDESGIIYFNKNKENLFVRLSKIEQKPENKKSILVIFDIPERQRKIRTWLRNQLKD